mmetsp:Transcript_90335/g.292380  ORF Transcript_90335/g.292380 Transcript_90335/m.292380 type:complete len:352 (-) Transcript_90335:296-1351(-)
MSGAKCIAEELSSASSEDVEVVGGAQATRLRKKASKAEQGEPSEQQGWHQRLRKESSEKEDLPPGWVRLKSRSKPGAYYYAHVATKHTQAERPAGGRRKQHGHPVASGSRDPTSSRSQHSELRKTEAEANKAQAEELARKRAQEAEAEEAAREEVMQRAREKRAREKAAEAAQAAEEGEETQEEGEGDEEEVTQEELARWKENEELREKEELEARRRRVELGEQDLKRVRVTPKPDRPFEPHLEVMKDGERVEAHMLDTSNRSWTLGRAAGQVDIAMIHASISRLHAVVTRQGAEVYLTDAGSTHGTTLNGLKLEKNKPVQLHEGGCICFGGSTRLYVFREHGPDSAATPL